MPATIKRYQGLSDRSLSQQQQQQLHGVWRHHSKMKYNNNCAQLQQSTHMLNFEQVQRLIKVMRQPFEVHGIGNFPTLQICLRDIIRQVTQRVQAHSLKIKHVKMNGGLASHILAPYDLPFNDVDLIFDLDLSSHDSVDVAKNAVLDSLLEFLPSGVNKEKISHSALKNAYVRKMVKVGDGDVWSLISLNNDLGRFIELKFVDRMRRQFEFSVDSFQITLDSLMTYFDSAEEEVRRSSGSPSSSSALLCDDAQSTVSTPDGDDVDDSESSSSSSSGLCLTLPHSSSSGSSSCSGGGMPVTRNFYPTVTAESMYGDFRTALWHLDDKLIDTKHPEEIRGGGLLKYCQLLVRGYRAARPRLIRQLERYMCSRFFIDFPDIRSQHLKLQSYLDNHFAADTRLKHHYLVTLHRIVDDSTVCLMGHERRMTLQMIEQLAQLLSAQLYFDSHQPRHSLLYLPADPAHGWIELQVF